MSHHHLLLSTTFSSQHANHSYKSLMLLGEPWKKKCVSRRSISWTFWIPNTLANACCCYLPNKSFTVSEFINKVEVWGGGGILFTKTLEVLEQCLSKKPMLQRIANKNISKIVLLFFPARYLHIYAETTELLMRVIPNCLPRKRRRLSNSHPWMNSEFLPAHLSAFLPIYFS